MTVDKWLAQLREEAELLRQFVSDYYPTRSDGKSPKTQLITAPEAEAACVHVRRMIAAESKDKPNAAERFDAALAASDFSELYSLLNSAWFGVPESTGCWVLPGFREAVALLEDPPEGRHHRPPPQNPHD